MSAAGNMTTHGTIASVGNISTSGTITSAADTGTAVVPAGSRAVTDFTSQGSTTAYNVPGNENFNEDNAIDYIIASTEDPVA
jgi:hypothetical protein